MSDCFDHGFDAYEDMISGRTYDEGYGTSEGEDGVGFVPNPLYYHMQIEYTFIKENASYLHVELVDAFDIWIPKKIIRNRTEDTMYVHTQIFKTIFKQRQEELKAQR